MKKLICIILLSLFWGGVASAENIPVLKCFRPATSNQFTHNLPLLRFYTVSKISKSLIHYSYQTESYFWDGEYSRDTGKLNIKAFKNKEKNILAGKIEADCQEKFISDAELYRIVKEKNTNTAWKVDSKFIKPECFHIIRFGDGGAEWYKKYFNEYFKKPEGNHWDNPIFKNFVVDIGKYLNKEVPLNHSIKTGWTGGDWIGERQPSEISLTRKLKDCMSEEPETKVGNDEYEGDVAYLEYRVVKSYDIKIGKELAPNITENFESIKLVEVVEWGGGSMPPQDYLNIYGVLNLKGEKVILPLKNDVIILRNK